MPPKPKSRCCFSSPQCRRCPLRVAAAEPPAGDLLPDLFHEVLRADRRALPDSVTDALRELAQARSATAPVEVG